MIEITAKEYDKNNPLMNWANIIMGHSITNAPNKKETSLEEKAMSELKSAHNNVKSHERNIEGKS